MFISYSFIINKYKARPECSEALDPHTYSCSVRSSGKRVSFKTDQIYYRKRRFIMCKRSEFLLLEYVPLPYNSISSGLYFICLTKIGLGLNVRPSYLNCQLNSNGPSLHIWIFLPRIKVESQYSFLIRACWSCYPLPPWILSSLLNGLLMNQLCFGCRIITNCKFELCD